MIFFEFLKLINWWIFIENGERICVRVTKRKLRGGAEDYRLYFQFFMHRWRGQICGTRGVKRQGRIPLNFLIFIKLPLSQYLSQKVKEYWWG